MAGSTYQSGTDSGIYTCPQCSGTGTITHRNGPIVCPLCHGQGQVNKKQQQKYLNAQPLSTIPDKVLFVTCPECGGSKEVQDPNDGKLSDCPVCKATGEITEAEKKQWLNNNGGV